MISALLLAILLDDVERNAHVCNKPETQAEWSIWQEMLKDGISSQSEANRISRLCVGDLQVPAPLLDDVVHDSSFNLIVGLSQNSVNDGHLVILDYDGNYRFFADFEELSDHMRNAKSGAVEYYMGSHGVLAWYDADALHNLQLVGESRDHISEVILPRENAESISISLDDIRRCRSFGEDCPERGAATRALEADLLHATETGLSEKDVRKRIHDAKRRLPRHRGARSNPDVVSLDIHTFDREMDI